MNIKMATNSQLSIIESKKQTKQTSRTGAELEKWRTLGRWPVGRGVWGAGGRGEGIKKHRLVGTE